ncbi:MAG: HAD-IC family P-type ATPase, partial [Candidatus Omnitrophota bacterium]
MSETIDQTKTRIETFIKNTGSDADFAARSAITAAWAVAFSACLAASAAFIAAAAACSVASLACPITVARSTAVVAKAAAETGISRFKAGILPDDKLKIVAQLQAEGKKVAVVGDGFNDAPALSRADMGIALASGTDVAVESADITLMRSDLRAVCDTILLSRAITTVIRQNLCWPTAARRHRQR